MIFRDIVYLGEGGEGPISQPARRREPGSPGGQPASDDDVAVDDGGGRRW